jgi:ATP-dependent DNA helicase RecG
MADTLTDILSKIEAPLAFCSKESFRHLHLIRDLDSVMWGFFCQMDSAFNRSNAAIKEDPETREIIERLKEAMNDFDSCVSKEKMEKIEKALNAVSQLKHKVLGVSDIYESAENDTSINKLSSPLQYLKGVGPKMALLLEKKGLKTVEDLLYFVPRRYEDRRVIKTISSAELGKKETVIGKVMSAQAKSYGRRMIFEVPISDDHDIFTAKWFKGNQRYLRTVFTKGKRVIMTGEVTGYFSRKEMLHPDFEIIDDDDDPTDMLHYGRIVPIYSETEGLHQKSIRRIMLQAIERYAVHLHSPLPLNLYSKNRLSTLEDSIRSIHFPGLNEDIENFNFFRSRAHRSLVYDELFFFELGIALKKKNHLLGRGISFSIGGMLLDKFYRILPFPLTESQKKAVWEIHNDMGKPFQMNRLLQGDVGCGKTIVAMSAMVAACENGYQTAIMAPTEILSEQHHTRIREWADKLGLRVAVLTGSKRQSEKRAILDHISSGDVHIVIGTHALIQEGVAFNKLGLVVIDEQHRFGVIQRAAIREKGVNPDVLVMTATPIPRTLAMTVYGDLDTSVIDEMPPGRKAIKTKIFYEKHRNTAYEIVRKELAKGNQAFIVYPLVEESEMLDLKDATRMAKILQEEIFPGHRVGLIHGRMKAKDKDEIMSAFSRKEIGILVSTTVIEVGIDIPQASLMIIEHAERFGLSQLHQLRGRIGRGDIPAHCILMSSDKGSSDSRKRLRIMESTNDGFMIAEEDLAIRGPGEFMGTRQSGLPDFRVAHIVRDMKILAEARADALALVENDPYLDKPEHRLMKEVLLERWGGRLDLAKTG